MTKATTKKITLACDHVHFDVETQSFIEYKAGDTLEDKTSVIDSLAKNTRLVKPKPSKKDE